MLDIIRVPVGYIIEFCYKLVPNYAIALLLFALIMKLILFPTGIKQQKNTVKQASLRPKEMAIRNRYAGRTDKATQQKMNEELMALYQKENYNPAGGCLPMILQLLVVFALYAVVINPLQYVCHVPKANIDNIGVEIAEMYKAETLDTTGMSDNTLKIVENMAKQIGEDGNVSNVKNSIPGVEIVSIIRQNGVEKFRSEDMLGENFKDKDLPNFTIFGGALDLSLTPNFKSISWLLLIPLLTFVSTFGSMKLSKKYTYQPAPAAGGDAGMSMKMMEWSMPLMSTFFTFSVPAVVAVYWIYQNVLGVVQQFVMSRLYPYPTFTEEEYKEAEREMNKGKKSNKSQKNASKKRAAHRIDLDDEPEDAVEEPSGPLKLKEGTVPPAALKDESDKPKD